MDPGLLENPEHRIKLMKVELKIIIKSGHSKYARVKTRISLNGKPQF